MPARARLLNAAQLVELAAALEGVPPGGGLWSGPKVAQWIAEKIGRDHIHPHRGWVYLKRLGMSRQAPRARHERAAFKKNSKLRWTKPRRPTRAPRSRSGPSTSTASA
ncbi:MAG: winged helix-turn-helix domain-containing protein [Proteobacteria bacterium]|nr:winged helix-turn-helix domain-containing protein [Pseudomonadota bacterium]